MKPLAASSDEREKIHRKAARLALTGLAALLGSGIVLGVVQANIQEWAKANGQDQYLVRYAGPIIEWLATVAQTTTFHAVAWTFIGGVTFLWIDYAVRRGAKKNDQPQRQMVISSNVVLGAARVSTLIPANKFFSRAEKERIVDTMNFIQERFTNGRTMMWEVERVASNPGDNEELDKSIATIQAINVEAEKLGNELDKIRNESNSYPVDFAYLLRAKPVYLEEFITCLYGYANALYVSRQFRPHVPASGINGGALAKVVDSEKRHLLRSKHYTEKWLDECDEEMRAARRALEK